MTALELKIPPVGVAIVFATLMWLVAHLATPAAMAIPWSGMLAIAFLVVGAAIAVAGVVSFRNARTTVNPTRPESASVMVTSGVYGITRNPMYLGLAVILTGWAVYLSNPWCFALLPVFVLFMNRFQIQPEERALQTLFGDDFDVYRDSVRRWI